ncbi:hypothetical protein SKAU_G00346220 [Synaphobranchus kaupii]|uniref:Uncharacterized protein n=1 Tax=Synaphobranchus kaupii TaxID=118154 RepID=A0A9Q1IHR7_SYNKA|nr:hypothetical protein SKAU_G00346220 [Synaphobranchus kaupii]
MYVQIQSQARAKQMRNSNGTDGAKPKIGSDRAGAERLKRGRRFAVYIAPCHARLSPPPPLRMSSRLAGGNHRLFSRTPPECFHSPPCRSVRVAVWHRRARGFGGAGRLASETDWRRGIIERNMALCDNVASCRGETTNPSLSVEGFGGLGWRPDTGGRLGAWVDRSPG